MNFNPLKQDSFSGNSVYNQISDSNVDGQIKKQVYSSSINKSTDNEDTVEIQGKKKTNKKKTNKKKIFKIGAAIAGGLALAGSFVMNILRGRRINELEESIETREKPLRDEIEDLNTRVADKDSKIDDLNTRVSEQESEISNLEGENKKITEANKKLESEVKKAKKALAEALDTDSLPGDARARAQEEARKTIDEGELGYDIMKPPTTGKRDVEDKEGAIDLPKREATTNRAGMTTLDVPEISENGEFDFDMPKTDAIKVSTAKDWKGKDLIDQTTTVSQRYSDSVRWNNDKISRDILQNFFDGHGQTLDGVRFHFEPVTGENGKTKYKVRIEGDSSYTPDKALYLGASSKQNNAHAAGNYGEGIKMVSLKLLSDKGADKVKIGSNNWQLTYKLGQSLITDDNVMCYDLVNVPKEDGNYIEFETDDIELLKDMRKTIDRFYHSSNKHFETPDFENDKVGIKLLKQPTITSKGEKGGIYIAGQRFEFDNDFDGLEGGIIFLKQKPPAEVIDISRDRTSLSDYDLYKIGRWLVEDRDMPKEEKAKLLMTLEPIWDRAAKSPFKNLRDGILSILSTRNDFGFYTPEEKFYAKFPKDKYVAYSNATSELCADLRRKGFTICDEKFASIGMQTIKDLMGDARAHEPIKPTKQQQRKILILKEALKVLSPELLKEHFSSEELDTKIFLFDRHSGKERKTHGDALAEAIVDFGKSEGFWIDKSYLDRATFSDVLETALHELSHKAGGDESSSFSYKLTDVNKVAIDEILNNPEIRTKLKALNELWEEIQ